MNDGLKLFLSMSFSGSLLILLLLLCHSFLKNKLSRQWQYYIWLVVIARFLLPFTPEISVTGSFFQAIEHTITENFSKNSIDENNITINNQTVFSKNNTAAGNTADADTLAAGSINAVLSRSPAEYLCFFWLVTALVLFVRKITLYQSFVRYIKAGRTPISDTGLLDQLAILGEDAGVKNSVELFVNPLISSPLLIGFFKPSIVLPDGKLSDDDFRYTVLHELIHYQRHDMFYKWLVQITLCLHWFNPLVHLMSREINQACEFSCDEALLSKIGSSHAGKYGETLLNAMVKSGHYKEALASVTLNENKKTLKERLEAIMNFTKKSKTTVFATIILTLLFCAGAVFLGTYASSSRQRAEKPPVSSTLSPKNTPAKEQQTASTTPPRETSLENASATFAPSASGTENADMEAISIIENSGTWGESIERLLPNMSEAAIEQILIVYIEKHIFSGISSDKDVALVKDTIKKAYTYLSEDRIEKIEKYIETLR